MKKSVIGFAFAGLLGIGLIAVMARMPAAPATPEAALWARAYSGWRGASAASTGRFTAEEQKLVDGVSVAAAEIMTFTFENADAHFRDSIGAHFTGEGLKSFMTAIRKSYIVESVKAQSQTVTAKPGQPVRIYGTVVPDKGGQQFWVVGLPLEVTYASAAQKRVDRLNLLLMLQRPAGSTDAPKITRWIAVI